MNLWCRKFWEKNITHPKTCVGFDVVSLYLTWNSVIVRFLFLFFCGYFILFPRCCRKWWSKENFFEIFYEHFKMKLYENFDLYDYSEVLYRIVSYVNSDQKILIEINSTFGCNTSTSRWNTHASHHLTLSLTSYNRLSQPRVCNSVLEHGQTLDLNLSSITLPALAEIGTLKFGMRLNFRGKCELQEMVY